MLGFFYVNAHYLTSLKHKAIFLGADFMGVALKRLVGLLVIEISLN